MKQHFHKTRRLLSPVAALLIAPLAALSQTSVTPIPFISTLAGIAAGGGNTLCTTGFYKNIQGVNTGDNCSATQATLTSLYDVQVDAAGNVYTSENGVDDDIRVVYRGGAALASLLAAANPSIPNFTPLVGNIYTIAGGLTGSITTKSGSSFLCGNITGGVAALDSTGNGCPAAQSYLKPRGMAIDQYGNIFTTSTGGGQYIRVIYVGGASVAKLITLENPTVTAPKFGYIYKIVGSSTSGFAGDGLPPTSVVEFVQPRYLAVDSNENIYISDSTTGGAATQAASNVVRMVNSSTGIITTIVGETSCENANGTTNYNAACPAGNPGTNVPAAGALLNSPYALFVDPSNNLYIADYYNNVLHVIYMTAGSTIMGLGSNLTVGNIYTVAGGGAAASTLPNTLATAIKFGNVYVAGIDHAGNIYVEDGTAKVIWRFDAKTALGTIIAGGGSSATALPKPCASGEGQTFLDNYGDGCPATQANISDTGGITFDPQGNFYIAENGNGIVRQLSYHTLFPSTAAGTSASQPEAFELALTAGTPTASTSLMGASTTEYIATVPGCVAAGAPVGYNICEANVTFTPQHAGQRAGSLSLTGIAASTSIDLSGIGLASDLAIDPGTQSTLGSGLSPAGVAADSNGNVYVADRTSNSVLKGSSSGTTLTTLINGLNAPAGIALDGMGNIYVANSGANKIAEYSSTGTAIGTFGTGLSNPQGVAVDALGNVYAADTGNNRIVQIFANGGQIVLPIVGLSAPKQLWLDSNSTLYIIDSGNNRIVTYSGLNGQSAVTLGSVVVPSGIAVDAGGNIYVTDNAGKTLLLYAVGAASPTTLLTDLGNPIALAVDPDANLFLVDTTLTGLLELRRSLGNIVLPLASVTATSAQTTTQSITVDSVGNTPLNFIGTPLTTLSGPNAALFSVAPSTTNGCSASVSYTSGLSCNLTASFTPTGTGTFTASTLFNTNATNTGSASAQLTGTGKFLITTTTTLNITSPAAGPYYYGQTVVFTTGLSPASLITSNGSETFSYTIDGQSQPKPVSTSQTTLTLTPQAGPHEVSVTYNSDGNYATSSATVNYTVLPAVTTTTLVVTPVNSSGVLTLLFTATVASPTASGETGTVSFYAGTQLLATVSVGANGVATYSSSTLSFASNSFTAAYAPASSNSGIVNFAASTSAALSPVGDFTLGIPTTAVSIPQGGVASVAFTVASVYSGAGTVTASCTGLPANSVCRFQPQTLAVSTAPQTQNVLIYTNVSSNLASVDHRSGSSAAIVFGFGLPLGLGLLFVRRRPTVRLCAIAVVSMSTVFGVLGCSSNTVNQNSGTVTAPGTYAVGVVFTGSGGLTANHTATISLTVVQDSGTF